MPLAAAGKVKPPPAVPGLGRAAAPHVSTAGAVQQQHRKTQIGAFWTSGLVFASEMMPSCPEEQGWGIVFSPSGHRAAHEPCSEQFPSHSHYPS